TGSPSAPLGSVAQKLIVIETQAVPQTRLVLLTDGLTERIDVDGNMLTERAFGKMLLDSHSTHPEFQRDFLQQLLKTSDHLASSAPLADDITVVALDFI
ncbi:MAG: SpoIIE family protein phosphatase, partial [Pseudobdellovibrionaceae bacterium]